MNRNTAAPTATANPARHAARPVTLLGVPVDLDISCVLALGLATWMFATGLLPDLAPGHGPVGWWLASVCATAFLLLSNVVHALAHCAAGDGAALHVERVLLLPFGGAVDFLEPTISGRARLRVALAGPLASFTLAVGALVAHLLLTQARADLLAAAMGVVALGNLLVALLNVIPAPGLDGGAFVAALTDRIATPAVTTVAARVVGHALVGVAVIAAATGFPGGALWIGLASLAIARHAETGQPAHLRI